MNLYNKSILITGGSEGLGFALARLLIEQQANVIICSRSRDKLSKAENMINSAKLRTFQCDVTDYRQTNLLAKNIPVLDVLINNAGIFLEGPLEDCSPENIANIIDVNVKGVINTTKACLPLLKKRPESYLINIASTKGIEGEKNLSVYCASKFAVHGFTEALKLELANTPVKVFGFYPASMQTDFHEKAKAQDKNKSSWMDAHAVAEVIAFALTRNSPLTFDHLVVRNK